MSSRLKGASQSRELLGGHADGREGQSQGGKAGISDSGACLPLHRTREQMSARGPFSQLSPWEVSTTVEFPPRVRFALQEDSAPQVLVPSPSLLTLLFSLSPLFFLFCVCVWGGCLFVYW